MCVLWLICIDLVTLAEKGLAEASINENSENGVLMHNVPFESGSNDRIRPRALIFKARDKELSKIKKIIETDFPEVKILYITTGPPLSILRVIKSTPLENQNSSVNYFILLSNGPKRFFNKLDNSFGFACGNREGIKIIDEIRGSLSRKCITVSFAICALTNHLPIK